MVCTTVRLELHALLVRLHNHASGSTESSLGLSSLFLRRHVHHGDRALISINEVVTLSLEHRVGSFEVVRGVPLHPCVLVNMPTLICSAVSTEAREDCSSRN